MSDETKILIAVITSVCSAVVSVVTAVISSRASLRTTAISERGKHAVSRAEKADDLSDQLLKDALLALEEFLRAIQNLKDRVSLVASTRDRGLDSESAMELFEGARTRLFVTYEKHFPALSEEEGRICHRAKELARIIEQAIFTAFSKATCASQVSDKLRTELLKMRQDLSELQDQLRDSRMNRVLARALHIVE